MSSKNIFAPALLCGLSALFLLGLSGCGSSTPPPIAVAITAPNGTQSIDQAQTVAITASVANDAKNAGVAWSVSGGGTLTNQTTTSATYNTPASVPAALTATVTATSITDSTKSATLQIKVNPLPAVTMTSIAAATAGTAYNAALTASGGTSPYTWSVNPTTLPPGLSLNSSTGVISGTPTGGGGGSFAFKVTDAAGDSATSPAINFTVNAPPALTITTPSLPAGVMGTAYSQTLQATGGVAPYKWSYTGSLPAGLSLSSAGVISGTPTGTFTGTSNFAATVTDSQTPTNATNGANLGIAISAPTLKITPATLPGGTLGTAYNQTLGATGGITPYAWSISVGALPAGLTLNGGTGAITGTPTGSVTGPINFTVKVTDAEVPAGTATAALSITITAAPLSVVTSSLPTGVDGSNYSTTLQAAGGVSPYTWQVTTGSLPAGLTLSGNTISGSPTGVGTTFTVTVTDAETPTAQTATKQLTITVNPALSITTATLAAGTVGTSYSQTLAAAGGITPYAWAVTSGSLPAGLTLNASTGAITGKPTGPQVGQINFTVTVTDSENPAKTANANLSITISAPPLSVTTLTLPGGTLGTAYNQTLGATGGITPYAWSISVGALPAGLTLNGGTGAITGTPTGSVTGPINFTVKVTDAEVPAGTATAALSITITAAPLSVVTSSLPTGVDGSNYSTTLQAAGGVSPYTWQVTTGSLPAGLTLSGNTISGSPTGVGTTFTVTVTDAETPTAQTATKQLTITVNPALSITTATLAAGTVGTSYSQTLAAAGGITPYAWAVTSGSLPAGLTLNASTGAITGKPTGPQVGQINFTVTVTDSENPAKTANANLSITISAPTLTITTGSLATGVINQSYNASLSATGGIAPYSWTISAGSLPPGLNLSSSGAITGTDSTQTGTFNFTVQVTDSESPAQTKTKGLSISINNSAPLQITTTGLPAGVINTPYSNSAFLSATGGIQPYTWSISSGSLPPNVTLNASTGQISGTPTSTGTFNFTAKVTDSSSPMETATANLSITVNGTLTITTASVPNGSVSTQYNATVSAGGGIQPYSWNITSGSLPPGLNYGNNNNSLSISGQPTTTGSYPFTVQVTDNQGDTASQGYTIVIGTQPVGYTISGTVSYSGSKTGWTYLELSSSNCNGCNNLGTSISEATLTSTGAFTIHGVTPGTYTLQAFMDNIGYGAQNASNPTGSTSNLTVTDAGLSGVSIVLTDPAPVVLSSGPSWSASSGSGGFNGGALVSFGTITNNNGIEMAASYTLEWSTSSSFASVAGNKSFPARGNNNPWIVTGLTSGTTYYFRAEGVAVGGSTSNWSAISSGITVGAPSTGNAVSGTVTFSGTATGPLYVGFYDQNTGNVYADQVGTEADPPTSPASYSVKVPTGSNYFFFGILDQNNSGMVGGPGQISNVNGNGNQAPVVITGPLTNEDLTLSSANSAAVVMTQSQQQISPSGTTTNYSIGFNVNGLFKLPVAVEIASDNDPGVVIPADIANNAFNGNSDKFNFWTSLNGATPKVGDQYTLNVTYSDNTTQVLTVTVGAVLNAFATDLAPQGSGVSVTPNFSWTDPANASNYTYQFWLCCDSNGTVWQIPGNNSNSNGFSSSITSITWGVDPTGSGNLPNVSSLSGSTNYSWQIQASDTNGNSAQVQVSFETAATPLTLPASGALSSAVVGQSYSGAINASGGVGPNYTFSVNGSQVPTDGSQYAIADGIWVSNNSGNTLSIGGTPSAAQTVTLLNITVTDSGSNTAGPDTYTITVNAASPLSIQTATLPGANEGWAYNSYIQASGGVQPYTWTITSGSSSLTAVGLAFTGNPSNNQGSAEISGTPSAAGTPSFTVQVTDNVGNTASQPLSIAVTDCPNNSKLTGNYAMLIQGWSDSSQGEVFTGLAASFVANGAGSITGGTGDFNDPADGYSQVTFTGTSCVGPNNQGLMTINTGSGSRTLAFSLQSGGNGNIIWYDTSQGFQGSGVLLKQTTPVALSKITGPYAMGLIGVDQGGNRFGVAGAFTANGTADWVSGQLDANDSGNVNSGNGTSSPIPFSSSNVSAVNATTGRGTVGIDVSGVGTLNFAYYVVSASQLLLVQTDAITGPGGSLLTGQILQQSGTFTAASLDAVGVLETQGLDTNNSPATPDAQAGFFTPNGSGSLSVTLDDNDGGTMSTGTASGTYSVASNGRVTTTLTGENHPPLLYMIAKNQAILLSTGGKVSFGTLTPQVGSSFTLASLDGNYLGGNEQPVDSNVKANLIQINANGAGSLTGTQYQVQNCGSGCWEPESSTIPAGLTYQPVSGGPAGKFEIDEGGVPQVYLYIINDNTSGSGQAVILNVGSSSDGNCTNDCNPSLTDFHQ
jgi:hypothetical protein